MKKTIIYFIAIFLLYANTAKAQMFKPEEMAKHIEIITPEETAKKPYPVVLFMQGSGGGNERANMWGAWLKSKGIASVLIDNAGVRNTNRIGGVLPVHLANDYYSTIQALKNNPDLDLQRHALMGFSLGATAALLADKSPIKPQAVIALYPGTNGQCRITHEPTTKVMIFYGDQDDWGTYLGHRNTCQKATRKSDAFRFITLENAAHGFDSSWTGTWGCCGQNFTSASNPTATDVVKTQLLESFTSALLAPAPNNPAQ